MTEETKEKKPRGPRKTPLQRMEADRDQYAKEREVASLKLNAARAALRTAQATFDAADAAYKAMDAAVKAQTEAKAPAEEYRHDLGALTRNRP